MNVNGNTQLVPVQQGENKQTAVVINRVNSKNQVLGQRATFAGLPAAQLRAQLKDSGLKGKDLTAAVNEALRGEKDVRVVIGQAYFSTLVQQGFVPDHCDLNKGKTGATFKLVKVSGETPQKPLAELSDEELAAELQRRQLAKDEAQKN